MLSIAILGAAVYASFSSVRWVVSTAVVVVTLGTNAKNKKFTEFFKKGVNPELKTMSATFTNYTFEKNDFQEAFEFLEGDWCLSEQEAGELMLLTTLNPQKADWEYIKKRIAELKFYSDNRRADSLLQAMAKPIQNQA